MLPVLTTGYGNTVAAQVSGTAYTSPNFGYTVTWQSPWYVTEADTDENGFDVLSLADGESIVYFSGGRSNEGSPQGVVADYAEQIGSSGEMTNLQPLDPAICANAGNENGAAVGCYRADQTFGDGTVGGVGILLKAWALGDGVDLLLEAYVDEEAFASYLPRWQQFGVYAAGQAVPTTTAGCDTVVEHGATFCFDRTLAERDRSDITEAVRLGQDAIARYFGNPDLGNLRINGFDSAASSGDQSLASTLDRSVAVYAGSDVWQSIPPLERVETVVHELFHVYQNVMTESGSAVIPLWFSEGSAEAVGYQVVSQLGVTDQTEIYDLNLFSLTEFPTGPLADLQTDDSMNADEYPLAYIAVQYLLGSEGKSVAALGDLYTQLAQGATFEDAFATAFGVTLPQFYAEFAAMRPSLQPVTELPDDFWPNEGDAPPAPIAVQSAPPAVGRDQQMIVVAKTEPLTDCDADMQAGAETIQRQTYANGEGEIFWLITIPVGAPVGTVQMSLTCDAAPALLTINIT